MITTWESGNGIVLTDLVPAELRRRWVAEGYCPDRDLYSLFSEQVRGHPDRAAVIDTEGVTDYATLDSRARRIAAALVDAGLGARDIVAVQVPNGWRAVAAELAVAAIGAVALPYPAIRGRRGITGLLGRGRVSAVIAGDPTGRTRPAETLAGVRGELPHLRAVFAFGSAPEGCRPLDGWLADPAAGRDLPGHPPHPEAPARILVTSGSEAEPKMIAYSHNAMAGGRGNYVAALHDGDGPMRNLVLVPLAPSYGSLGTPVTLARHGGTLVLLDGFDPAATLRAITDHRPTHLFAVPTMLRRLAGHPPVPGEDTSSLRTVVTSSGTPTVETIEAARARFGRPVLNVYGSADGVNCHTPYGETARGHGVTGFPDPAVAEIRIVDPAGRAVAPGGEGEIWARGPMTPLCYVNAPELDARYRGPGGWVRTGDRGRIEPDGRLRVIDRLRRVVKRGGYSISPLEVERQLVTHPAIAEAVCVPVPDPDLGERLCACVVQSPGTEPVGLDTLNTFLAERRGLERAKLPERLVSLPDLPLGPTGKVCHRTLADIAAGNTAPDARPVTVPHP